MLSCKALKFNTLHFTNRGGVVKDFLCHFDTFFAPLNTGMTDYALNLDAPVDSDLAPDPLAPLADYLEPHERDLALMVAFARFLLSDGELAAVCGTDDPLRVEVELAVRAVECLLARDRYVLDECGGCP